MTDAELVREIAQAVEPLSERVFGKKANYPRRIRFEFSSDP
jgi:hypothetical protein